MITAELIQDCKKHKHKAQRQLFDCFADQMFHVCRRYMNETAVAEDMLSQGFTKVFKAISGFEYRDLNSLKAWIKRIMINECLMELRSATNFAMLSLNEQEDMGYQDHGMDKMAVEEILQVLNELPKGYRTILNLYAIEGYSHAEIAGLLNINEGTSKSQLNKARKMMKERLTKDINHYGKRKV